MAKTLKRAKSDQAPPATKRRRARKTLAPRGKRRDKAESKEPGRRDAYGRYLNDIGALDVQLLTAEQELAIGKLLHEYVLLVIDEIVKDLETAEAVLKNPRCRPGLRARARELIERVNPQGLRGEALYEAVAKLMDSSEADEFFEMYAPEDGKELRDHFIDANLRLAVTMARKYDRGGMPLGELVQEGNIGLMHAVLRFDWRKGFRFSTYAGWWIRHAVGRAIADKSRQVRIPVHMVEFAGAVYKLRQQMAAELGREPDDEEVAARLRRDGKRIQMTDNGESLVEKVRKLGTQLRSPVSLDQPSRTDDGDGDSLHDTLPDEPDDAPPWATLKEGVAVASLKSALAKLKPIEADVLRLRFDIGGTGDDELTFREVGDKYGLSRERIRQIQNVALERIRRDAGMAALIREVNGD